jgi:hypothetical protein
MNKKLAKVESANLEIQERDILNFWIHVKYEDFGCQGIGGYALDTYDEKIKDRVGTAYGCEMIRQLLKLFGVNDFSEMKGKYIWVLGEGDGLGFKPLGLQMLNVDSKNDKERKVVFAEVVERFLGERNDD